MRAALRPLRNAIGNESAARDQTHLSRGLLRWWRERHVVGPGFSRGTGPLHGILGFHPEFRRVSRRRAAPTVTGFIVQATGTFVPALLVGAVIALEALFAGPICGASMNPARSLAPALVAWRLDHLWVYLTAPPLGAALGVATSQYIHGAAEEVK